ncbi:MAG TPA: hypothetical protein VH186_31810 [Chloroflexia bacterium]|nr:hypothetical protein [Chloroflexia bacterium]
MPEIRSKFRFALIAFLVLFFVAGQSGSIQAANSLKFDNPNFQKLWQYSDKIFSDGISEPRGYTWGPLSLAITREHYEYLDIEGTERQVQYFDKGRMELNENTGPGGRVTAGLLLTELLSGKVQEGDNLFVQRLPAPNQVAGDDNQSGRNTIAPTYTSFARVATLAPGQNKAPDLTGQPLKESLDKDGKVSSLVTPPANQTVAYYEPVTGHNVARIFADYQKSRGKVWDGSKYTEGPPFGVQPLLVFGYPLTEPYWVKTEVNGSVREVLVQLFERRALTYTPSNPDPYKVEMGNIGQHYYQWRYKTTEPLPPTLLRPVLNTGSQPGHLSRRLSVVIYAPDGKSIYSAANDGFVRRWNAASGEELAHYHTRDTAGIYTMALSPDGKYLATTTVRGFVVWDTAAVKVVAAVKLPGDSYLPVGNLVFSPDSRLLAYSEDSTGTLKFWDLAASKEVHSIDIRNKDNSGEKSSISIRSMSYSPDGKYIATTGGGILQVWQVDNGQRVAVLDGQGYTRSLAFSRDGKYLVAEGKEESDKAGRNNPIYVWDWAANRLVNGFNGHGDTILSLSFSPDGTRLLSASSDNTARIWPFDGKGEALVLKGHAKAVWSAAFSPDGKTVVTASEDGTIRTWDAANGKELLQFGMNKGTIYSVAAQPGGPLLALGTASGTIRLVDRNSGKEIRLLQGHSAPVNTLAFSPDGKTLASSSGYEIIRDGYYPRGEHSVRLWDIESGQEIANFTGNQGIIWALSFSPDGKILACAGEDRGVNLIDAGTGAKVATLRSANIQSAFALAFSPDGKTLAAAGEAGIGGEKAPVELFDLASGQSLRTLLGHKDEPVRRLAFSPDGKTLFSGGEYYTCKAWRVSDGAMLLNINTAGENLVLSPDGRYAAVAGYNGDILIWDAASGLELSRTSSQDYSGAPWLVYLDNQILASGHLDGTVRTWQVTIEQ